MTQKERDDIEIFLINLAVGCVLAGVLVPIFQTNLRIPNPVLMTMGLLDGILIFMDRNPDSEPQVGGQRRWTLFSITFCWRLFSGASASG